MTQFREFGSPHGAAHILHSPRLCRSAGERLTGKYEKRR